MRSPFHLSVCVSLITFERVSRLFVKLIRRSCHWMWPGRHVSNLVASTVSKWRTLKPLRGMQNFHQSAWDYEMVYAVRSSVKEQLNKNIFIKKISKIYECERRLKVQIRDLFYGDNLWTVALTQMKFDTVKDHGHTCKIYLNRYLVWQSFNIRRWCNLQKAVYKLIRLQ
jgi:hypothetical protein